jgi:hypothetical protein
MVFEYKSHDIAGMLSFIFIMQEIEKVWLKTKR